MHCCCGIAADCVLQSLNERVAHIGNKRGWFRGGDKPAPIVDSDPVSKPDPTTTSNVNPESKWFMGTSNAEEVKPTASVAPIENAVAGLEGEGGTEEQDKEHGWFRATSS